VGSSTGDFEIWLRRSLVVESVSLCGSSVKGTWRESSHAGDPEGYIEKTLDMVISFHRGPSTGDIERWMKGAL
jgi:hypothetical protein